MIYFCRDTDKALRISGYTIQIQTKQMVASQDIFLVALCISGYTQSLQRKHENLFTIKYLILKQLSLFIVEDGLYCETPSAVWVFINGKVSYVQFCGTRAPPTFYWSLQKSVKSLFVASSPAKLNSNWLNWKSENLCQRL